MYGKHNMVKVIALVCAMSVIAYGNSYRLDGTNDEIAIADSATIELTQITVEYWIMFVSVNAGPRYSTTNPTYDIGATVTRGAYAACWSFSHIDNLHFDAMYNYVKGDGANRTFTTLQLYPAFDAWAHFAMTYANNNGTWERRMYINGILVDSLDNVSGGAIVTDTTNPITMGKNGTNYLSFRIAELRIWNYARTIQQINTYKSRRITWKEDGLVINIPFNMGYYRPRNIATNGGGTDNVSTTGGAFMDDSGGSAPPIKVTLR